MELLFESRREVVARKGRLIPFQNTAEISPEPILKSDTDIDGGGVALYGSVLRDKGRFRMWYQAAPRGYAWDRDFSQVAVAESDDGISWHKPAKNLTNLGLHSPSIIKTPEGYLATGCWKRSFGANASISRPGYYIAYSADGLEWKLDASSPHLPGRDVITGVWDYRFNCGEAACKYLRYHGGIQRRAIATAEFNASRWMQPQLTLMPGDADDIAAQARGCRSADYYGMSLLPVGARGMVGLIWMFYHQPPYFKSGAATLGGSALVPSYREEPGAAWMPTPGRMPFLEHPTGAAQNRFFYAASSPILYGEEHFLYCTAFHRGHSATLNEECRRDPAAVALLKKEGLASIHLAKWKRDRIFGFRAETEAELILHPGTVPAHAKLLLNYRASFGGWISVRLSKYEGDTFLAGFSQIPDKAIPGYDFSDCVLLQGDSCAEEVTWKNGGLLPEMRSDTSLLITIRMFMAECYAYETAPL